MEDKRENERHYISKSTEKLHYIRVEIVVDSITAQS